jgi:hypothetical protein
LPGSAGTSTPSALALSARHSHSNSEYRLATRPDALANFGRPDVQYVTTYSTCFDRPSPARCGSVISICSETDGSSPPSYPAGAESGSTEGGGAGPTSASLMEPPPPGAGYGSTEVMAARRGE